MSSSAFPSAGMLVSLSRFIHIYINLGVSVYIHVCMMGLYFVRRTVQTRMSLMEGSSSIFQLICDLPPGSHQVISIWSKTHFILPICCFDFQFYLVYLF